MPVPAWTRRIGPIPTEGSCHFALLGIGCVPIFVGYVEHCS